jgi:hypothetical protein
MRVTRGTETILTPTTMHIINVLLSVATTIATAATTACML